MTTDVNCEKSNNNANNENKTKWKKKKRNGVCRLPRVKYPIEWLENESYDVSYDFKL